MNKTYLLFLLLFLSSCAKEKVLVGDWEARDSSGGYAEFSVYKNFIQIYTDVAGPIRAWDYKIVDDTLHTKNLNYRIDWIAKDSLVLRNPKFTIELRGINSGVCLSEVEGQPEDYLPYMDSFYERRNAR